MKHSISYFFFLSCLMVITPLYAGTQTLTTYYPAPQGNYKNMKVNNSLILTSGTACAGPTLGQTIYIFDNSGILEFCDSTGGPYILTNNSLWNNNSGTMSPFLAGENVSIPSGAGGPGNLTVAGATTVGTIANPSPLVVNGTTTLNNTLAVTGNTTIGSAGTPASLNVSGNTILGQAVPGNTTTISSPTTNITGNTTLGTSATTANIAGNVTLGSNSSNTVTINGTLKVCDSTGACGALMIDCHSSPGSCYAVYE